jgi:hypothetical protein
MALPLSSSSAPRPNAEEATPDAEQQEPSLEEHEFELEMLRLAEEHKKLLASMGLSHPAAPAPASWGAAPGKQPDPSLAAGNSLVEKLYKENTRLVARVSDLERSLAAAAQSPRTWDEREKEYEALLEEKSEAIRELRAELQEYKDRPAAVTPKEEELVALSEHLENDRRQLQEDEAAMEEQARQMEMNIARQRAEIARQRVEVQRMFADLQLELDQVMRESGLRERLAPLHRRAQEVALRTGLTPSGSL